MPNYDVTLTSGEHTGLNGVEAVVEGGALLFYEYNKGGILANNVMVEAYAVGAWHTLVIVEEG